MSGLTADARVLCKYMRNESLNFKMTYGSNQPLNRLIYKVAESTTFILLNRVPTQNPKGLKAPIWSRLACRRIRQRWSTLVWDLSKRKLLRILCTFLDESRLIQLVQDHNLPELIWKTICNSSRTPPWRSWFSTLWPLWKSQQVRKVKSRLHQLKSVLLAKISPSLFWKKMKSPSIFKNSKTSTDHLKKWKYNECK